MDGDGSLIMTEPWSQPVGEVADALATDTNNGLSSDVAKQRLERVGPNALDEAERVPTWRKLLAQLQDPLIYLLIFAVVVSFAAWILEGAHEVPFDVIVIVVIIVANAVLGYVQEARAEDAVAALAKMAAVSATVIRDGRQRQIDVESLVPGDLLVLSEGDSVSADGRLVETASLMIAEASLTGESEAVLKAVDPVGVDASVGDRVDMVFSGTDVTRGRGVVIVTATGMDTEIGHVARLLSNAEPESTPLQREIGRVGKMLGIAVIVIAVVVIAAIMMTSDITSTTEAVDVLLVGVSLAVAAVPEGLPAILSVVLAIGVQRMAKRRAIVKRLSSVETLGSASVICSDKTGTLTRNEMTIERVVTMSGEVTLTGTGYSPIGEVCVDGAPLGDGALLDEVRFALSAGCLSNDAMLEPGPDGTWSIQGDPTEAAFLVGEAKLPGLSDTRRRRFQRVGEIPFTSERKLMTTLQADADHDGEIAVVTKGAPDVLLARCTHYRQAGEVAPLDLEQRHEILATVNRLANLALRTLAVAYRPALGVDALAAIDPSTLDDSAVEDELIYLGMVGILDPPRDEAKAAVAQARQAGVRVIMITGDHPVTASRIASELGIIDQGARAVPGPELEQISDDRLREIVREVSVFARVAPEHKLRIVDALQHDGSIVAMTGDGVNDAPALKEADIGVAMGVTGTDVSKGAADMILADDNFATIVVAIEEGRGIFENIRRFLRFLLSSNIGEVLTMFLGVMLAGPLGLDAAGAIAVPLLATQILWVNLLTDTAPALAMGVDPPPDDVMERSPRGLTDRVIDTQMWGGIIWVGLVTAIVTLIALDIKMAGGFFGGSGDIVEGRSMAFTTLVFAQLFNTLNARSETVSAFHHLFTNAYLWGAIGLSLVLQVLVIEVPFLNSAFGTTPLTGEEWMWCFALASCVLIAGELRKLLLRVAR